LRELKIDVVLNAGLRFDIHDSTQGISTAPLIGKHDQLACHDDGRKVHDSAFRKNNCGARFLVQRSKRVTCVSGRQGVPARMYDHRYLDGGSIAS
jgi:hypothetical protein